MRSNLGFGAFGAPDASGSLSYLYEPPSFAAVSDPNVVVSLKNVLKKDGITKSKGLEDLVAYAQAHPFERDGGVEESLLQVWIQIYPRLSIDNATRVRELSHTLQLELMKSARRRMEKYVPKVVGAWLSGTYDKQHVVVRAARHGLSCFLNTPDKVTAFWRKCQLQILEFAISAVQETQGSLSDERMTTEEDAKAKYFRVVAASLALVLGLLQSVEKHDFEKCRPSYDEFFAQDAVWKSITFAEAKVRRTACQLLSTCLDLGLPYAESTKARHAFVTGGLKTDQDGTASDYVSALGKLTRAHPDIWSTSKDKKSPVLRLQAFIARGSQHTAPQFWEAVDLLLLTVIPHIRTSEAASGFLNSLESGITHRDEPRSISNSARACYIDALERLLSNLAPEEQLAWAREQIFPVFQYVTLDSDNPAARTRPLLQLLTRSRDPTSRFTLLVDLYFVVTKSSPSVASSFQEEWTRLASLLCDQISLSLAKKSAENWGLQENIASKGGTWFGLVGQIHNRTSQSVELTDCTASPSRRIIFQCISVLENGDLKPFGAAQILEHALDSSPHLFVAEIREAMSTFLLSVGKGNISNMFESHSAPYLLSCVSLLGGMPGQNDSHQRIWTSWVDVTLGLSDGQVRDSILMALVSQERNSEQAQQNIKLQEYIVENCLCAVNGLQSWDLFETSMLHNGLSEQHCHKLAGLLLEILEKDAKYTKPVLKALEIMAKVAPDILVKDDDIHTALLSQLLNMMEIGGEAVSARAAVVRSLLEGKSGKSRTVAILQSNLDEASPQSLDVETLAKQALDALNSGLSLVDVFPSTRIWMESLKYFVEQPIDSSISITNSLGGAVSLIMTTPEKTAEEAAKVGRDRKGRSVPARMALFSTRLLEANCNLVELPRETLVEVLFLHCITIQVATDQAAMRQENGLWKSLADEEESSQVEALVSCLRRSLNSLVADLSWSAATRDGPAYPVALSLIDRLVGNARSLTPLAFYSARALSEMFQSISEANGLPSVLEERFLTAQTLKATPGTVLLASAVVTGLAETLQSSHAVSNICNKLVSDVAGAAPDAERTMITLVLLTLSSQVYDQGEVPITQTNRIVFAVKQILSWLEQPDSLSNALRAEMCRVLMQLLPAMQEVYGSYWEATLDFCINSWKVVGQQGYFGDALPLIYASLRLSKMLEGLQDKNDDLGDALNRFADQKAAVIIGLLNISRDKISQPLKIVDGMLCREVDKVPVRHVLNHVDLFGLVSSESRDIQTAAFNLLHRVIPAQQEQASIDVLLDKRDARLPNELLSLLLEAPDLEHYSDEMLAQFPLAIRRYLLAWKLVFDAYSASSIKVRGDLTENLKASGYVPPLLNFTFDVLGHSAAHPLNLDKAGLQGEAIRDYDIKLAESVPEEKGMQWLLVHLYFLTLKYAPGLFRSWFMDCRSKQTRIAVESWTSRYFSPLIIMDVLDETQKWADEQEPPAMDEQELLVKVSRAAREVSAGYEVDEAEAAIVIKIPPSYPIEGVTVSGLRRVAVSERKWQSWIMTTQGVITFSNGSIVDGLQVFRRNIVGALKGQSECAICYSIISTDKRMPDKRCTTCKNTFHRVCLYKWFQSSNQNTCPLCRNPIDYLGADTAKRRQT